MDISHPWTKYEVARLHDEERLVHARAAMRATELRKSVDEVGGSSVLAVSWFDRLRRRQVATDQATIKARPV